MTQEWRRLQGLYAEMSEAELEAVADDGYELTDIAKQALHAEISRRGLQVVVRLAPAPRETNEEALGDLDPADLELTPVSVVEKRDQAEWVKTILNDAGIPCYFGNDLVEDVDRLQFLENGAFGVKVRTVDQERARYALKDFAAKFENDDEEAPDFTGRCPKCHSTEIVFQGLDSHAPEEAGSDCLEKAAADTSEVAYTDANYNWSCDACGYQWKDDGIETEG